MAPGLVLIAEDEEPIAEVVATVVEDAGYTPLLAAHGREALELARAKQPALLITDLMMPYLSGAELIAALRSDAAAGPLCCRAIPVSTPASLSPGARTWMPVGAVIVNSRSRSSCAEKRILGTESMRCSWSR